MEHSVYKKRFYFMCILGVIICVCVLSKLAFIQLFQHGKYQKQARIVHEVRQKIPPQRGMIYDRNLIPLAVNVSFNAVYCGPNQHSSLKIAQLLADSYDEYDYLATVNTLKSGFPVLIEEVDNSTVEKIKFLNLDDVYFDIVNKRYYPQGKLAQQVVGCVDIDNSGISGIEYQLDEKLKGSPGWIITHRDIYGNRYVFADYFHKTVVPGQSIVLTLDAVIQWIAEKSINEAVRKYGIKNSCTGYVVVLNPRTGEILALASSENTRRDKIPAVNFLYESGSTFKIIPACIVIEEELVNLAHRIYCEQGCWKIGDRMIHEADGRKFEWLTLSEIIEKSSNIGIAKISQLISKRKFYEYILAFGFGAPTGVELPGEEHGMVRLPELWSSYSKESLSFGQELLVTPMQVANAYAAIANKGVLVKPRIVKAIISSTGDVIEQYSSQPIRRVISESTAKIITDMLVDVVEYGTGRKAKLEICKVAGKTGTTQKSDKTGGYIDKKYIASFVGFFPVRDPQFLILVIVDEPEGEHSGGNVAAPVFKSIAERLIPFLDNPLNSQTVIDRFNHNEYRTKNDTDSVGYSGDITDEFFYLTDGAGSLIQCNTSYEIITEADNTLNIPLNYCRMPNVIEMSIRSALRCLAKHRFRVRINGSGIVVSQFPPAGTLVDKNIYCELVCAPLR